MGRMLKVTGGSILVVAGAAMLVLPGPGLLTIALGVTLLADEFAWARRLSEWGRSKLETLRKGRGQEGG